MAFLSTVHVLARIVVAELETNMTRALATLLCLSLIQACAEPAPGVTDGTDEADTEGTDTQDTDPPGPIDKDEDGFTVQDGDCDDDNKDVHPDADEICDQIDNDCDGEIDLDDDDVVDAGTFYLDRDKDGFGDPSTALDACDRPTDRVEDNTDCDDTTNDVAPGHEEICGDGLNNDCDATRAQAMAKCDAFDLSLAHAEYRSTYFNDQSGRSVRTVGDADGDGTPDLLIGAPHRDLATGKREPGRAYLVYGGGSGVLSLSTAHAELVGEDPYDSAGQAVAAAGDQDGDGLDDMLIGAWAHDTDVSRDSGAVYLMLGGTSGTVTLDTAHAVLTGGSRGVYAGYAMDGGVDLDGDDKPDFAIGAFGAVGGQGAVYIYTSLPKGTLDVAMNADVVLTGPSGVGYAGAALSTEGDTNGDGVNDIVIGAYTESSLGTYSGAVYLVEGGALADISLDDADATMLGETAYDFAGYSVDFAGDFDGDGLDDMIIGAMSEHTVGVRSGAAYVVLTSSGETSLGAASLKVTGEHAYARAGDQVSAAGDVDGDGLADIAIGAPGQSTRLKEAGAVYIVYGGTTGTKSLSSAARIDGLQAGELLGSSIDQAGDLDGDGSNDLLIGALGKSGSVSFAGATYLMLMNGGI